MGKERRERKSWKGEWRRRGKKGRMGMERREKREKGASFLYFYVLKRLFPLGLFLNIILIHYYVTKVYVGEEGGVVSLLVERAQGVVGAISVEWRTIDRTAISNGKIPPDYVVSFLLYFVAAVSCVFFM